MHSVPPPPRQVNRRWFLVGFPHGDPESAEFIRHGGPPFWAATFRGEGGVICGLIKLDNGLIVFHQIQIEDGQ
jgi:hypothetical protein